MKTLLAGALALVAAPLALAVLAVTLGGGASGGCLTAGVGTGAGATADGAAVGSANGGVEGAGGSDGAAGGGAWLATAYGPPWGGIQGDGITATGLDLRSGEPAYEIAVDPRLIALRSYVHIWPNPFGTSAAFYAGDTGGAILGRHIDIYDWRGRASQDAWGARRVSVTPAPNPGAGNLLGAVGGGAIEGGEEGGAGEGSVGGEVGPGGEGGAGVGQGSGEEAGGGKGVGCSAAGLNGSVGLTPGQTARIKADGSATAPRGAPAAVMRAVIAGNLIHTLPYPEPDAHFGTLARLWPAYDCSGATSFLLYEAGLMGAEALDSTGLESFGLAGPGRWISVYANSAHAWIVVAGIALDTADYGGPPLPAGSGPRWRGEALANLRDGSNYVVRHPAGL